MRTRRLLAAAALVALTTTACGTGTVERAPAGSTTAAASLLSAYGLEGLDPVALVDRLDRLPLRERPDGLMASVRPGEVVLSAESGETTVGLPDDLFYLSVAPYAERTHECFHHSLTTCTGELRGAEVQVRIVDETNDRVLVDEARTTYDNGFLGFWLPRDVEGTLQVTSRDRTGQVDFATDGGAPTCVTTLRLG